MQSLHTCAISFVTLVNLSCKDFSLSEKDFRSYVSKGKKLKEERLTKISS